MSHLIFKSIKGNAYLNDSDLSWKAKGIMTFLLNLKEYDYLTLETLKQYSLDGRDSTASAINNLVAEGYIVKHKTRDENNQYNGFIYKVNKEMCDGKQG